MQTVKDILARTIQQEKLRLGYPTSGWLGNCGTYLSTEQKLLLEKCRTQYLNNIGESTVIVPHHHHHSKEIELDVLSRFAKYLGLENWHGYVTNGSTEGNMACLWWLQRSLGSTFCTVIVGSNAHYSIAKCCELLKMSLVIVECDTSLGMNIEELNKAISNVHQGGIIIVPTLGSTREGTIDDVVAIYRAASQYCQVPFRIHADAAMYGVIYPIVRPKEELFDFIDTITISCHKIMGTSSISGIALAKKDVVNLAAFSQVEYLGHAIDSTISGSRSGFAPIEVLVHMEALGIGFNVDKFSTIVQQCIEKAAYLQEALGAIIGKDLVHRNYMTVFFSKPVLQAEKLQSKYTLMSASDTHFSATTLLQVSMEGIEQFVEDAKQVYGINDARLLSMSEMDIAKKLITENGNELVQKVILSMICSSQVFCIASMEGEKATSIVLGTTNWKQVQTDYKAALNQIASMPCAKLSNDTCVVLFEIPSTEGQHESLKEVVCQYAIERDCKHMWYDNTIMKL